MPQKRVRVKGHDKMYQTAKMRNIRKLCDASVSLACDAHETETITYKGETVSTTPIPRKTAGAVLPLLDRAREWTMKPSKEILAVSVTGICKIGDVFLTTVSRPLVWNKSSRCFLLASVNSEVL